MSIVPHEETPAAKRLLDTVRKPEFQQELSLVLPGDVTPEKFVRSFATAILQNPKLAEKATGETIVIALLRCAQDGLLPDGNQAVITVYGTKAQYLPMIGGYRHVAGQHGWAIRTTVVYANDEFEVEHGVEPKITHRPTRPGHDRGDMVAAYAVGAHRDGRREVEIMHAADIDKRRQRAQTQQVWEEWPERMWEKTVGKALFKKLPLEDERQQRIVAVDDNGDEPSLQLLYGTPGQIPLELEHEPAGNDEGPPASTTPPAEPSFSEEEEHPFTPPVDDVGAEKADEAGLVIAPRTAGPECAGKSIVEISKMEHGLEWLQWAVEPARKWNRETSENAVFGLAVVAWLAHYHPDLLPRQEDA